MAKRKEALNKLTQLSQEYGLYGDKPKTKVSRVEIIDRTKQAGGRVYTNYDVNDAWVSYQDNGRTLKVFINESDNG